MCTSLLILLLGDFLILLPFVLLVSSTHTHARVHVMADTTFHIKNMVIVIELKSYKGNIFHALPTQPNSSIHDHVLKPRDFWFDSRSWFNPFPNGKILDLSEFKAFADDKIDVSEKMIFFGGRAENIVGNGYRHFLHFLQCFQKPISPEP